ncbi:MAG: Uma2 family endonuclease [Planctomycetia bacterium]|nr:Uma2 family endonuclease [Planctomycetia bacterium]
MLSAEIPLSTRSSQRGEPTWELAHFYPVQGEWTEEDYLALNLSCLVELSDGCLEFPAMPTLRHQFIVRLLFRLLDAFVTSQALGEVLLAPLPIQLFPGKVREPDIVFLRPERLRGLPQFPQGADLVVEVVSADAKDRQRDLEIKPQEYARARIAEYWIVDPELRQITVLTLDGQTYREHGKFGTGTVATSVLLGGFAVAVDVVFAAGPVNP